MTPVNRSAKMAEPAETPVPAVAGGPSSDKGHALSMTYQGRLWKPRLMHVNCEPFIVAIPPRAYNDGAAYIITYVCPAMKVTVAVDFDPGPLAFPRNLCLAKEAVIASSGPKRGVFELRDGRCMDVRRYMENRPSAEELDLIGRIREEWRKLARAQGMSVPENGFFYWEDQEANSRFPIDEQPRRMAPEMSDIGGKENGRFRIKRAGQAVEYCGKTYEFSAPKIWENLEKLIDGGGAFVRCDKGLKKFFKSKDAKAFYNVAIQPKGAGRKGDGMYRLNIWGLREEANKNKS